MKKEISTYNKVNHYLKEDHRSYIRNLCSCEKKTKTL